MLTSLLVLCYYCFFSTSKRTDEVVDDAELIGCACCSDRGSGSEISA
jgi:hypothetical protein